MNILLLNWRDPKNPKSGGAEIVTLEHAKYWVKKGHTVTWFTSMFIGAKITENIGGVNIIRSGGSLSVYLRAPFYYFTHRKEIDIVIDEIHGVPFMTPLYVRKPKIAFIHEVAGEIWDYMYPFPVNVLGKMFESLYFNFYKNIPFWTDAESTIDELVIHGIKREDCTAIHCPAQNKALDKFPQKEKNPTFIFVSRLVKMKGIEDVIKAFSFILKDLPSATLWIVGDGDKDYVHKLKELVSSYKIDSSVIFFGRVSNDKKLELMRKSHLLLHASVKEGWGLVVIEAASQATPSVVYKVGGLVDSVKNNKTGLLTKKNTPDYLAEEVVLLFRDKKRYVSMQEESMRFAKSLTWDHVVKESLKLIESS